MRALIGADTAYASTTAGAPQGFAPLVEEVAYEQWHRMLFARFLEQNNLLMHPQHGVPVSLDECADIAASEGEPDEWMVAAKFAGVMLPGIFQRDDPAVRVQFAANDRTALERILKTLPSELFTADDALGWVYQFWQSERRAQVNKRGDKIGSADLPPVTQYFTEHYMVRFLLENSLGAWWADRHPDSPLQREWEYLRFRDDGTPAAGTYEGWPNRAAEVTLMDPCCGSGHFLVAAADMLRQMRIEEEELTPAQAAASVLQHNLFGLEIDPRCLQLAAFNLALDAWKAGGYQTLPVPNLACSGIAIKGQRADWHSLSANDDRMRIALDGLYDLFQDAPDFGSLIDPRSAADAGLWSVDVDELLAKLDRALQRETVNDPAAAVFGATAAGTAKAAQLLARNYWLVATNPPFLTRGKQSAALASFLQNRWPDASPDLASGLLEAFRSRLMPGGIAAFVQPYPVLFLSAYTELRKRLLTEDSLAIVAFLGPGAFGSITGKVVNVALIAVERKIPSPDHVVTVLDAEEGGPAAKALALSRQTLTTIEQLHYLRAPDHRVTTSIADAGISLAEYADSSHGQGTFDTKRFNMFHWEVGEFGDVWVRRQSTVASTVEYGGCDGVLRWEQGEGALASMMDEWRTRGYTSGKWRAGVSLWGRAGVLVSQMETLPATLYAGAAFDENAAVLIPRHPNNLPAIWAYVASKEYGQAVRLIDPSLKVTPGTLVKVPFDLEHWQGVAAEQYPNGLPKPHSDDPTQWLFKGNVIGSDAPLQVAVARLVGFRWPDQKPDALDQYSAADGILCVPALPGQQSAQERLRALLSAGYSGRWSASTIDELLAAVGSSGVSLESWLRDGFFEQHCKLFHHRPFVWHIWDGRRDGFSALVNYHRLDRLALEKLAYTYLGSWLERQRDERNSGLPGADDRLAAAQGLQRKLAVILEGEGPHDIFVRWKKDHEQSVGWNPDPDDGVRLNIRPFIAGGVLRWKPNIKWDKDRGKNPDGSERVNDRHLTLAAKREARDRVGVLA